MYIQYLTEQILGLPVMLLFSGMKEKLKVKSFFSETCGKVTKFFYIYFVFSHPKCFSVCQYLRVSAYRLGTKSKRCGVEWSLFVSVTLEWSCTFRSQFRFKV